MRTPSDDFLRALARKYLTPAVTRVCDKCHNHYRVFEQFDQINLCCECRENGEMT